MADKNRRINYNLVITAIAASFSGWQAKEAWQANRSFDEKVSISVDREYQKSSTSLNTDVVSFNGPAMLDSHWTVEIYNLSPNSITMKDIHAIGYNDETAIMSAHLGTYGENKSDIGPLLVPGGGYKRIDIKVGIPLPRRIGPLAKACKCTSFGQFSEFMTNHGLDELGNLRNLDPNGRASGLNLEVNPKNAGVLIEVESASGKQYFGYGKWYPGISPPKFPG